MKRTAAAENGIEINKAMIAGDGESPEILKKATEKLFKTKQEDSLCTESEKKK